MHQHKTTVICKVTRLPLAPLTTLTPIAAAQKNFIYSVHPFLEQSFIFYPTEQLAASADAFLSCSHWPFITTRALLELPQTHVEGINKAELETFLASGGLHKLRALHEALSKINARAIEFPRYKIDSGTTAQNLHAYTTLLSDKIHAYRLAQISKTPEANEIRLLRATRRAKQDAIYKATTDFKFTVANARQALGLIHKLKSNTEIFSFWLKILCTSQDQYYSRAQNIRPVDISELVDEFESVTIEHELKPFILRHLRALFSLAETVWGKYQTPNTVNKLTETEVDFDEGPTSKEAVARLLEPLRETALNNLANRDETEPTAQKERRTLTRADGTVIYFPRISDFAIRADYFVAMSAYRLAVKEEAQKEASRKEKNTELMRLIKARAQNQRWANVSPEDVL